MSLSGARVRMYRQGLGDCFLLTFFGTGGKEVHVLIDCGVLVGTPNGKAEVERVVADIAETTGGKVDVVVATHEHWDHVSGFNQAREGFDALKFGRVWMAWTEDPADDQANELREDRERRKASLANAVALWRNCSSDAGKQRPLGIERELGLTEGLLNFFGEDLAGMAGIAGTAGGEVEPLGAAPVEGAPRRTTADALAYLREHRDERKEYLEPGMVRALPGLADVRVYVLGPPREQRLLKKEAPSKRDPETYSHDDRRITLAESFFVGVDSAAKAKDFRVAVDDVHTHPFEPFYRRPASEMQDVDVLAEHYLRGPAHRMIDYDWLTTSSELALALDSDTNNTSLVLAFELGRAGKVLLFPADAQVGNWLSWEQVEFRRAKSVDADDLLARTVLYKVGHHGSHNATLREKGLEKMTSSDLVAMIPVDRDTADKQGWAMPFSPLFERLHERCKGRVLLSDADKPDGRRLRRLSEAEREDFEDRLDIDELYMDLRVEP